ncbi:NAD(P)-dependent oxidoreductase [Rhodococcus sp. ARC_M6]|uniref:NAD-dependent epimerase/dehydratase family protein n=1 Tax=Rhodococcus sp. ARC_M6 TaxID=2928852 RepID=UPI001FB517DC|nr:NAD(P)-dependent oxidoreductase [Rhodococcus sp. ARC_M6]MCJ0904390.1 NAD(P)-dependent oxidoreductase [Rhodococcus sp. ARC_M6]
MSIPTWVVGSGGLLGSAVARDLHRRGADIRTSRVPWGDPDRAKDTLFADARKLIVDAAGGPWRMAWCAGAGVNGTSRDEFARENGLMKDVLDELGTTNAGTGTIFHASSAGGVYAGAPGAPHTEASATAPLADYGYAKLDAESIVREFGERTGTRTVIGRFANLYGPGQNLAKPQGLISHLCRGYLMSMPISIYVPMDTLRDYVYVSDAAEMVVDSFKQAENSPVGVVTKIYASGRSVTIGAILGACHSVFRTRPNVVLASSPLASAQARDLRLRSIVWTELDQRPHRPLPAGIASTLDSIRRGLADQK